MGVLVNITEYFAPGEKAPAEEWFNFGLKMEQRCPVEAETAYRRAISLDPGFTSAHVNLGTLRYNAQDFAEAERCYREAIRLDQDYALAWYNLGNALDETGRMAEAVDAYATAIRLVPGYADAHYNVALTCEKLGNHMRALKHWMQYLQYDGQSPWAQYARAQVKKTTQASGLNIASE